MRSRSIIGFVLQGGDSVTIECRPSDSIFQVKAKVEVQAGLKAEMCSLYLESAEEPLGDGNLIITAARSWLRPCARPYGRAVHQHASVPA